MKFNSQNIPQVRKDIEEALKQVAEKHNIGLSIGNIRFSDSEFTTKLTVKSLDADVQEAKDENAKQLLKIMAESHGICELDPDKQYKTKDGKVFTFVKYNDRAKKNPFVVEDQQGTQWRMNALYAKGIVQGTL